MIVSVRTEAADHAAAAASPDPHSLEEHKRLLRLERATDVNAELAEIGLSSKSGWYASVLLYGAGGTVALLASLLRPEDIPIGIGILGAISIVLAGLAALGARYLANDDWATHLRLVVGTGLLLAGIVVAGDARVAFAILPLFVLITPTFLYGARFAVPYVSFAVPMIFLTVLLTPTEARVAHAVVTAGATLAVTVSLMVAERRTRALARANRLLAHTDPLTGVANTRRLREVLGRALGSGETFALFAIDLDNFKQVNDRFDHTTGDLVLKAVAEALSSEIGAGDLVARRGGDEFSVLIARPDENALDDLAQRLAGAIERARLATCPEVSPSGSVAWVMAQRRESISSVLQRSDDALHEAKLAFHGGVPSRVEPETGADSAHGAPAIAEIDFEAISQERRLPGRSHSHLIDPAWGYVVATLAPIGFVLFVLSAAGALAPLAPAIGMAVAFGLLLLAGLSFYAGHARADRRWQPVVMLAAIAIFSYAVAQAGPAGAALLDAYVVLALFGFYVMPPRQAAIGLVLCCGLFLGFTLAGDFPFGEIRAAVTICVVLVASAIIVKVRTITVRFVRLNRELSETDALTGVANVRALRLRVAAAVEEAQSGGAGRGRPVLMTVDLDQFKHVNDVHNHTTGDRVLEAAARAIAECVRIDEMVARRGGDEFFVLFDATTAQHVEAVIPRVRAAVAHARRRICPDLIATASVGHVAWEPGQSTDQFIAAADAVMHDVKGETRAHGYAAETAPAS
jgi:diguanylate cyclase (GGDEF)-like protein